MGRYRSIRRSTPGMWLTCALATDLATFVVPHHGATGVFWWVLLDLWLVHRIWRGGPVALTVFRVLQMVGAVMFGLVIAFGGPFDLHTPVTPLTVVLYGLSAWCLFAPALDIRVDRQRATPRRPTGETDLQTP